MKRNEMDCPHCDGGESSQGKRCDTCYGSGTVLECDRCYGQGQFDEVTEDGPDVAECEACEGRGWVAQ